MTHFHPIADPLISTFFGQIFIPISWISTPYGDSFSLSHGQLPLKAHFNPFIFLHLFLPPPIEFQISFSLNFLVSPSRNFPPRLLFRLFILIRSSTHLTEKQMEIFCPSWSKRSNSLDHLKCFVLKSNFLDFFPSSLRLFKIMLCSTSSEL